MVLISGEKEHLGELLGFFFLGTYYVHSYLVLPRMLFSYLDSYIKVASPQN